MKFSEQYEQLKEAKQERLNEIRFENLGGGLSLYIHSKGVKVKELDASIDCYSSSSKRAFPIKIDDKLIEQKIKEVEKADYYKDLFKPSDNEGTRNVIIKMAAIDLIKIEIEKKLSKELTIIADKFDKDVATLMTKYN